MAQTNLTIRIDESVKHDAEALFDNLGLSISGAINVFFRQAIREQAIPFNVTRNVPNAVTVAAIQEVDDMMSGRLPKNSMPVADFIAEMEKGE